MASPNRHWPSMFKSKPTNTAHHHDLNHRNTYTPPSERTVPEPKTRWNPKPEQLRILEAIFNSGIINPPRDEIRKIRQQLQAYGQIGDTNVFYWFQNRKSRTKHKHRQPNKPPQLTPKNTEPHKSSPHNSNPEKPLPPTTRVIDLLRGNNNNNNNYNSSPIFLEPPGEFSTGPPSLFLTGQQSNAGPISTSIGLTHGGFGFPNHDADHQNVGNCFLASERMLMSHNLSKKYEDGNERMKMQHHSIFSPSLDVNLAPTNYQVFQGVGSGESNPAPKMMSVYINDLCFDVAMGPFNIRETFGDDAQLLHSSGETVPTNEWGLTQQPLQNGERYYLLRPFVPSPYDHDKTMHLI